MDIDGLITELQIRGFDQHRIDTALRCLVHVYAVQDHTNKDKGGVLVEDVLNTYALDVTHAANDLFLERLNSFGRDVFRVKWGYEATAQWLEKQLWENGAQRWHEFAQGLDERYLGFFLPGSYEEARIVSYWKSRNDVKWLGVEVPTAGWNILRMVDDITSIGYALDLAFAFRRFDQQGIEGERTLIHRKAFESLRQRAEYPSEAVRNSINVWKFFSEFDPDSSDVVRLMKECDVSLEDVQSQIGAFYRNGLTTAFREGQYPPYLVLDKMKEKYREAVRSLLSPMEDWLLKRDVVPEVPTTGSVAVAAAPNSAPTG